MTVGFNEMVNTYTKIKLNIYPTPCINLINYDIIRSFQSYGDMLHTMSSAVPGKMDPQPGQIWFDIFTGVKLGGAATQQPRLHFAKLKERPAGRKFTRVQDLSKAVRHFRTQRYTCFGV